MESVVECKTINFFTAPDQREVLLSAWLQQDNCLAPVTIAAMPGDASFRRYYRVRASQLSYVVMDAPPEKESCQSFVNVAQALKEQGLCTPTIFRADIAQGFLLLSDFGDATYLKTLSDRNADMLYTHALDALSLLQSCRDVATSRFDRDFMYREWDWHQEWFLKKLLAIDPEPALEHAYACLVASATAQPQVLMHRDYHAGNLMVLENAKVGILDFQDALIGPITYDLASLLRDCYIDWPVAQVEVWALSYYQRLCERGCLEAGRQSEFLRWFDLMGVQRHLKALMTFARKKVRDEQPQYLNYMPRTLHYILTVSARYPELAALHAFYKEKVQPVLEKKICVQ
ncbi:MAG TPA: phosphotransferase [Gammaproteobacteria bacterium]|jgi:aminoglycoside/choline kinase family phosphotransferase|nr:phosphotransferase [Gammaproteobacteria bacterium]